MPRLRVDPWDPEYGASVEIEDVAPAAVDFDVETQEWAPRPVPRGTSVPCCAFVDGVRRVDVRLFAEEGDAAAPALAGSWAVGTSWAGPSPRIDGVRVGRALVVGAGMTHPELIATVGLRPLHYPCTSVGGTAPTDPVHGLQNLMREAEAELAAEVLGTGRAELAVLDGPLTYTTGTTGAGPLVGLIKRQSRAYLPPERAGILAALPTGGRTPLFRIEQQRLERYSWYVRLATGRAIDGVMTGVVRLEVSAEPGASEAARLADLTAGCLPSFASRVGRDPRAPQNLYPVGQLEAVLRHRLGDPALLRRAVETALWTTHAAEA